MKPETDHVVGTCTMCLGPVFSDEPWLLDQVDPGLAHEKCLNHEADVLERCRRRPETAFKSP